MLRCLFASTCAVVTVNLFYFTTASHVGNYGLLVLGVGGEYVYDWLELIPFALIGCAWGILGALWSTVNVKILTKRMLLPRNFYGNSARVLEALLIVTVVSIAQYFVPFFFDCKPLPDIEHLSETLIQFNCKVGEYNPAADLFFNSPDRVVRLLFDHENENIFGFWELSIFSAFFFFSSCVCAGATVAGGSFIPLIMVGAGTGRLVGQALLLLYPTAGLDPSIYSIIGASAAITGGTRLTISICIIMIELTGSSQYLLPIIMTVLTARWVGDSLNKPIYERHMALKGYPYLLPSVGKKMLIRNGASLEVSQVMASPVVCFRAETTSTEIIHVRACAFAILTRCQYLENTAHSGFPVVDDHNRPVGLILRSQLIIILFAVGNAKPSMIHTNRFK
jgi:chloride channel 7